MNAEPRPTFRAGLSRDEEHLLAARFGALQRGAGQGVGEFLGIDAAENSLLVVKLHFFNAVLQAGVPLLANIIDLGEFGHDPR